MIKVNLNRRSGTSAGRTSTIKTGGGGGFSYADFKEKIERYNGFVKVIGAFVAYNLVSGFVDDIKADLMKKMNYSIQKVNADIAQIKASAMQFQDYAAKKAQLENDAKAYRQKLEVLSTVMEGRSIPAKMLLQISQTIPKDVWLTDFNVGSKDVSFSGQSMSYDQISEFLKSVQSSSYFTGVILKNVEQNKKNEKKYQSFSITAKRRWGI